MPIEAKVTAKIKAHQQNLQAYEQAFSEELRQEYPLSEGKLSQLRQLAQQMELTDTDITPIEIRITSEVETYLRNLEQYRQIFAAAVRQEYPISNAKRSQLKSQQQNLGLTDVDIASVEAQINTEIETYQQKLQQYKQTFVDATKCKHYPSESTRKQLQQTWQTLELREVDVAEFEAQVNAQIERYQANLRQYEQEFADAAKHQYPLSEAQHHELRQRQKALTLTDEDVDLIETRLKTELEERQLKLQKYEQALASSMEYEYPLREETREELRELQKVLELENEDVALIEEQITADKETEYQYHSGFLMSVPKSSVTNPDSSIDPLPITEEIELKEKSSASDSKSNQSKSLKIIIVSLLLLIGTGLLSYYLPLKWLQHQQRIPASSSDPLPEEIEHE